jgi:hypothetical protein
VQKHTYYQEKPEALLVVSKETGREVTADKTNYMVKPCDQNAGQIHNMKTDNNFPKKGWNSSNTWEQC